MGGVGRKGERKGIGIRRQDCQTVCGDGLRAGWEECDDGNEVDGDGCSSMCVVEEGWTCLISTCGLLWPGAHRCAETGCVLRGAGAEEGKGIGLGWGAGGVGASDSDVI